MVAMACCSYWRYLRLFKNEIKKILKHTQQKQHGNIRTGRSEDRIDFVGKTG